MIKSGRGIKSTQAIRGVRTSMPRGTLIGRGFGVGGKPHPLSRPELKALLRPLDVDIANTSSVVGSTVNDALETLVGSTGTPPVIVQSQFARIANYATGTTLTFANTPTVGNILIFIQVGFTDEGTHLPTGFTTVYSDVATTANQAIWIGYREVQGGDGKSWASGSGGISSGGGNYAIYEFADLGDMDVTKLSLTSSGATIPFTAGKTSITLELVVMEIDNVNSYVSLSGNGTLQFDSTSALGVSANHPAVFISPFTKFGASSITWSSSTFNDLVAYRIRFYGF